MAQQPDPRFGYPIRIDPWSPSHDLGVLWTSVDSIAEHLAIAWERIIGAPQGRAETDEQQKKRKKDAQKLVEVLRPTAKMILDGLDRQINPWFRSLLEYQPIVSQLSDEQVLSLVENARADQALELFGVPAIQAVLRRSPRTAAFRLRLRRLFRRLATAPGKAGRPKRDSTIDTATYIASSQAIKADVLKLRQEWKGDLESHDARLAVMNLMSKHIPLVPTGPAKRVTQLILSKKTRPARAIEGLVQAAHPDLSLTAVRELLKQIGERAKQSGT